ncbi:hypothetical protein AVEN_73420-1 [Araneus ventricosus]|uniref:Uncharacterized protein n=1 Tax=Araneus ventricosus TaxID=182803 RepID=A0A4Y2QTH7_ARAVE|nr:hypothetical protein AVEN_25848-1 [Araneus ventricosus]GBN66657.1 hypothetical protein AVEN_73420-1 [Araneus ventricosus]
MENHGRRKYRYPGKPVSANIGQPYTLRANRLKAVHLSGCYVTVDNFLEPPKAMQKEVYEEWLSIDEAIPLAATITDLEICQTICEQDQALKVDYSDREECVEEHSPTNAEIRQALDILKRGVQNRSTNFRKTIRVRTIYK